MLPKDINIGYACEWVLIVNIADKGSTPFMSIISIGNYFDIFNKE